MPAAVPYLGLALSGASTAFNLAQGAKANRMQKQALDAARNYKRQDIVNPSNNMQVSTLGADLQREDLARSIATMSDNAALGGSRAIVGFLPNVLQQQVAAENKIAADLDQQYMDIQKMIASGELNRQNMIEQRENNDLLGYGNMYAVASQEKANANQQAMMGVLSAANVLKNSDLLTSQQSNANNQTQYSQPNNVVRDYLYGNYNPQGDVLSRYWGLNPFKD